MKTDIKPAINALATIISATSRVEYRDKDGKVTKDTTAEPVGVLELETSEGPVELDIDQFNAIYSGMVKCWPSIKPAKDEVVALRRQYLITSRKAGLEEKTAAEAAAKEKAKQDRLNAAKEAKEAKEKAKAKAKKDAEDARAKVVADREQAKLAAIEAKAAALKKKADDAKAASAKAAKDAAAKAKADKSAKK